MRCPACGFVTFDSLSTCKQCGKELPRPGRPEHVVGSTRLKSTLSVLPKEAAPSGLPLHETEAIAAADLSDLAAEAAPTELASLPKAGFWLRGLAFLLDVGLVALLGFGGGMLVDLTVQIGGMVSSAPEIGLKWLSTMATSFLVVLIVPCYFTLFVGMRGQTPGKMLFGLKIIRVSGEEVGIGRALLRWISQCLGLLPFGLGFLMAAFSRRKQALHDKIAGTCVVRHPS